jgi:hypothetical protein
MNTQNYPTWLVPIEIAKELKEIGFEEECHFFWNFYEDVNKMCCYADISEEDDDFLLPNTYNYNNKNSTGYYVYLSLPTWEQVFEWFREKGFDSYIGLENLPYPNEGIYYYFEISKPNLYRINQLDWQGEFDDYNEAREALVKALIQTYKNEQL